MAKKVQFDEDPQDEEDKLLKEDVEEGKEKKSVAKSKDERHLIAWKTVLYVVVGCAALGLGLTAFYLTKNEEKDDFSAQFHDFAGELIELIHLKADSTLGAIETLAIDSTSTAKYNKVEFPFFSNHKFEVAGEQARQLASSELVAYSPLVATEDKSEWEFYATANQGWVGDGLQYEGVTAPPGPVPYRIHKAPNGGDPVLPATEGPFSPIWQMSKAPRDASIVNYDLLQSESYASLVVYTDAARSSALSEVVQMSSFFGSSAPLSDTPQSLLVFPVVKDFGTGSEIVAHYLAIVDWNVLFKNALHEGLQPMHLVLSNTCGQFFTFEVKGPKSSYVGEGDLHNRDYSKFGRTSSFEFETARGEVKEGDHCEYSISVYPTQRFEDSYYTSAPAVYTSVIVGVVVGTALLFILYDFFVVRRQDKIATTVEKTTAIVSSFFPENVRDRILADAAEQAAAEEAGAGSRSRNLKTFLNDQPKKESTTNETLSKPIADLFPATTIMFADISGFTAWSSVREPSQVFTLLETIFHSFDTIAQKSKVFKVETVGDCYVAVCGLPEPRKDHAVVMARFARECVAKMGELTKELEVKLGPDTGDLAVRVGLHSGPVTAGVLRGERARFQLFGDTVNTAARIESTGLRNKIHISPETAECLDEAGKSNWYKERDDIIVAKGKGALQTYWLTDTEQTEAPLTISEEASNEVKTQDDIDAEQIKAAQKAASAKVQRLIDWNCEMLMKHLKGVVARREVLDRNMTSPKGRASGARLRILEAQIARAGTVVDEIVEIIELPRFEAEAIANEQDAKNIDVGDEVAHQLRDYVSVLASMYRENPFHCFEHASHVTMSVTKLLSRIVAPDDIEDTDGNNIASVLHDHTYGITSDPLTQFSVVLAGLIHDVDHRGVPNFILGKEDPNLASAYNNKSIAEQNSVDLAWESLMDPSFAKLRACIYTDEVELKRFRQLIVNSVMATDIFDKELGVLRKNRWAKAFQETTPTEGSDLDHINRKATIVIEHLIQASDVSHTMQHWHVYQKWNTRLFEEMYTAYRLGRMETDPSAGWYKGEIGFFDNYVIPLAKKLKECGVFGVASDEYLNYAMNNRRDWEKRGQDVVARLIEKLSSQFEDEPQGVLKGMAHPA